MDDSQRGIHLSLRRLGVVHVELTRGHSVGIGGVGVGGVPGGIHRLGFGDGSLQSGVIGSIGIVGHAGHAGDVVLVNVVQTSAGSGITVGVEVLHLVDLHVGVGPLELHVDLLVALNTQHGLRHGDHHLVALDLIGDLTHLGEAEGTVHRAVLGHGGGVLILGIIINDEIVPVPAVLGVAVYVDEELHPGGVGVVHGDIARGLGVEVDVLGIRGDLGGHDIVAARGIALGGIPEGLTVAVEHIPRGIVVVHDDAVPLGEVSRHVDGVTGILHHHGSRALELGHVGDELHVVVVEVTAAKHLGVTAVFLGGGVHKAHVVARIGLGLKLGDPLVPARHQHVGDVGGDGTVPLSLEVVAVLGQVGVFVEGGQGLGRGLGAVEAAAAVSVGPRVIVNGGGAEDGVTAVLSDGDVDGGGVTRHAGGGGEDALRPLEVHPGPAVGLVVGIVGPLILADGKEIVDVRGVRSHDHGLAVDAEPGLGTPVLLVNVIVESLHHALGGGVGIGHDLGGVKALLSHIGTDAHELLEVGNVVEINAVGQVDVQEINIGVGELFHVLAHDPDVVGVVVAVQRLGEPVHDTLSAVVGEVLGSLLAVLVQNILQVVHAPVTVQTHPQEVEQTHVVLAVGAVHTHVQSRGKGAAQIVGAREGAVEVVVLVGDRVGHDFPVEGVGDGHGAVAVVHVPEGARVAVQSHALLVRVGGIRPDVIGKLKGGGVLVGGKARDHADVDGAGGGQRIQTEHGGMLVPARDRGDVQHHLTPAVSRGSGPAEALLVVRFVVQGEDLTAAARRETVEDGQIVVVLPCHIGLGEMEVGVGGGAVDVEVTAVGEAAADPVAVGESFVVGLVPAVHDVVRYGGRKAREGGGVGLGGLTGLKQSHRAEIHPLARGAAGQRIHAQGGQIGVHVGAHNGGNVHHHGVPGPRGVLPSPGGVGASPAGAVSAGHVHLAMGTRHVGAVDHDGVLHVDAESGGGGQLHEGIDARGGEAGKLVRRVEGSHLIEAREAHVGGEIGLVGGIGGGETAVPRGKGGGVLRGSKARHTAQVDGLARVG